MIEPIDILIARKLKDLRKSNGLKQFYVAQALGLKNQQEYSDFEAGKRHFSNSLIQRICEFFQIIKTDLLSENAQSEIIINKDSNASKFNAFDVDAETINQILSLNVSRILLEDELEILKLSKASLERPFKVENLDLRTPIYVPI